jgi:hypothetical protein
MGVLNLLYLRNSIIECIDSSPERVSHVRPGLPRMSCRRCMALQVCDLGPTSALVLLLSALTRCCDGSVHLGRFFCRWVVAPCLSLVLSSALLLGYKLCHFEIIKMQLDTACLLLLLRVPKPGAVRVHDSIHAVLACGCRERNWKPNVRP